MHTAAQQTSVVSLVAAIFGATVECLYLVSANGCEYALEGAGENYFGKNDGILPPVQDAFGNCGY